MRLPDQSQIPPIVFERSNQGDMWLWLGLPQFMQLKIHFQSFLQIGILTVHLIPNTNDILLELLLLFLGSNLADDMIYRFFLIIVPMMPAIVVDSDFEWLLQLVESILMGIVLWQCFGIIEILDQLQLLPYIRLHFT